MGRNSSVNVLSPKDCARVNEVIRAHNYCQLDTMVDVLHKEDIHISRASLHRHKLKLEQLDGVKCQDENITVVVLVTRATGATDTVLTTASAAQIRCAISEKTAGKR